MTSDNPRSVARLCGLCGEQCPGDAAIGETWYCHGNDDPRPTCYMRAQAGNPGSSFYLGGIQKDDT